MHFAHGKLDHLVFVKAGVVLRSARRSANISKMSTSRSDALNALKVRWEAGGQDWSTVEDVADDLGEGLSSTERLLNPCLDEGLVERRGADQDPEYRLTRAGEMYVAVNS